MEAHLTELSVSAMSVGELFQGVRSEAEYAALETTFSAMRVLPISYQIAQRGGVIARDYRPSHGTGLADALIAATAQHHALELVTLNKKHFPMLENVTVPYEKR